jgi:Tol biopolymer transport system component
MQGPIVFDRTDASEYWIHTIDPSNGKERRIARGRFPRWSPDGRRIVFSEEDGDSASICVMNADGSDVRRLTRGHLDINASWHPDGNAVLFNRLESVASDAEPVAMIMSMRIGDAKPALLTDRVSGWFASAVWCPDGSSIAIASSAFGPATEVCLMNPRNHSLSRLTYTEDGVSGSHLDWSPDGTGILFSAFRHGQVDTYVIEPNGDNEARLTHDPNRIQSGAKWSPDGTRIVFHSTPAGEFDNVILQSELFLMDADGGNLVQLTSSPQSNAHPDW